MQQQVDGVVERDEDSGDVVFHGDDDGEVFEVWVDHGLSLGVDDVERVFGEVRWPGPDVDATDEAIASAVEAAFRADTGRDLDTRLTRINPLWMLEIHVAPASA